MLSNHLHFGLGCPGLNQGLSKCNSKSQLVTLLKDCVYIYVRKYQYQVTVVNNLEINVNVSLNISFALWNYDAGVVMD